MTSANLSPHPRHIRFEPRLQLSTIAMYLKRRKVFGIERGSKKSNAFRKTFQFLENLRRFLTFGRKSDSTLPESEFVETQSSASLEHDFVHRITTQCEGNDDVQDSAVMRLPPELLSLIFTNCRGGRDTALVIPRSGWFPWALGQVCSQWRQALWSTTEIWSDIKVEIRSDLPPRKQEILPWLAEQVMTRAHGLVSLRVPVLEVDAFARVMTPYSGRLQSLRLTLSLDFLSIFINLPLNFLSLTSLEVIIAPVRRLRPPMTCRTDALRNASHLHTFSIDYPHQFKRLGTTYSLSGLWLASLPWPQLTFLECRGAHSIADLHNVLSQCISLNECSVVVRASLVGETENYTHQPIILPYLRTLSIQPFSGNVLWVVFLEPFILPSLEVLESEAWGALGASEALVARSGCRLKEFKYFMKAAFFDLSDTAHLYNLLQISPSLVLLGSITLSPVMSNLISCGELLPHLTTIRCSVDTDGFNAFLDLMEQYPPGCGIHTAHIFLYIPWYGTNEEDNANRRFLSAHERFVAEGRDIRMEILY